MQDVGTLYLGTVHSVLVVPLHSVIVCVMYSVEQYLGMARGYIKPLTPSYENDAPRNLFISPHRTLDIERESYSFLREICVCVIQLKEHLVTSDTPEQVRDRQE